MEWQPSELFYYKNVSLLLHKDVTRRNGEVYTATLSELAGLRKTDQFKKDVRFHEDMTEVDVANTLKEVFPVLQNERFSCAASTKKNNARLDFHGERRVWDGRTIKRKITGHRCLYIVLDFEQVAHTVDDVTVSASQPVENESPQGAVQQPRGIPMSPVSSQSVQSTSIHGGFPLTQKCHLQPLATLGPAGIQVFQPTQKYQLQPVATLGRGTQTVQKPSSANVTRDSLKVDAVISTNDTSESNLSLTDSDLEDLMAYNEDMPTDQMDSLLSRSSVLSDGERTSKETEAMFAANKQQEITAQGLTSAPTITDSSGYYSEGSLSQPTEVSNKQKNDIVMNPSWGPLEGGTWFSINLNTKFQSHGHLLAIFAGIAEQKRVVKYEGNVWVGNTPRGNSPGTVPVVFRTPTSNGENGIEVGRASFTYFDERLLCNTDLQLPFFSNMEEQQRNNGASGGDDSDNSNASVLEQQAVDVLRWSLYTAAKNGFNQFIRLIFGTSAGRIIFETYKNKTALPEDIADANGHNDIAVYLREITERFSKEGRLGPAQSKIINWSELVRAVKESDSDHYEVEEKRWKDESLEKAYFADVSSSDSDKETTDSDEELKRTVFKDQDSISIHHVSKRDEQQWREDDILRSVDTSGDKKLSTSSEREKDDSGDRPHAKSGQDAFRVVEHSPHNLGVALLQASLFDESEEDNQESHDEDVEELEEGVTIIISGISSSTNEDAVLNYFENSRRSGGGEVGQIKFNGHAGEAVITFLEVKDRQRLLEGEHSINKTPITVNLQPPKKKVPADPVRIHVQGLSEMTTADCLCFYLEKFSEVDVEVYFCTKNNAFDIFHCKPGVQNVIQRKHALEGKKLNVTPHYPFLQDTTTMRVEMKCYPEVFEYIQINHGSKLQVVLEENKIEIEISKDSQAQAIIVSSAGNKTNCDRPWDERLSHLESFSQSFTRSQLDIASEIFDEIERRWEKSVSTAESSDFLVSFDDHKRIVKIIGKTSHVDKEWATMKELIQTVQQDTERMKTVVQVVEGNIPTSKLTLLGMSGICERLRDKHRHLDITVDSKGQKLALKGPRSLLQEAKVEVFTFISKIVERTIELPEKVINVLKSPPVSSFLQDLLKQRAICAVVLYGQGQSSNEVKVVGIDSSTAKKAENVLQDTILEKCYQLTPENVQLLGSGLSIDFQTSIASRFIDGITVNNASSIIWVCDTLKDRQECFQEVKAILKKSMELTQVRKFKIEAMKERLVDSSIDMRFSVNSEGIEVSGTSEGLKKCLPQVEDFISAVQKKSLPIDRPGMEKYFLKGKGPIVLKVTEEKHHCIIAALEHGDNEEKLAHGTMRTKAKNQEPICSYLSREEKNIFVIKDSECLRCQWTMHQSSLMCSRSRRPLSLDDVRVGDEVLGNKSLDNISESYDDDSGVFLNSSSSFSSSEGIGKLSFDITATPVRTSTPNPQRRLYSCPEGTSIAFPPLLSIEGLFAEINDDIGPSWRKLGRFLLNRECLLNNIDADFNGVSEKAYQVLLKWKEVSGDTATPKALFLALLQLKRTDVAKKLIKLVPSLNALPHLLDSVVPSGSTLYNNSSRLNPENLQIERTILSQGEKVLVCSNTETSQRFVLKQVEGEGKAFGVRKCIDCKALRQQSHRLRKTEEFLKELEMKQKMVQDLLGVTQQLQNHLHTQHQAISQVQFSCRNWEQYTIKKDLVQKELTLLHYELQRMIQSNRRISVSGIPSERIFNLATRTYTVCEEHREMHLQSRRRRSVCHHPEDTMDSEDNDDLIQGPLMCTLNVITGIARRRKVTQSLKTKKTSGNSKLKLAKSNSNPLSSSGDQLSHRHSYFLAQENRMRMRNLLVQIAVDWSGVPAFKMCSDFKRPSASSNSEDSSRDISQQTRCPKDQQINSSTSSISENDQSLQWLKGLEPDEMII